MNSETPSQIPFIEAKFYTPMRHRLEAMDLPASALTVFVACHMLCDADTGRFYRDDVTVRRLTGLGKSTVSYAFRRLALSGLVIEDELSFMIAHYEDDRLTSNPSYFRLSARFVVALSKLVKHHNPRVLLFALELQDRNRHADKNLTYSMSTLIRKRKLGSCPSRVYKALQFLFDSVRYTVADNATKTDTNLQFHILDDDVQNEETEQQAHLRQLHGRISAETKKAYRFAMGNKVLEWRELAKTTRVLIQTGMEYRLTDRDILRMAGWLGAYLARNSVQVPLPYLRASLPDFINRLKAA